jgi:hypothetical protein
LTSHARDQTSAARRRNRHGARQLSLRRRALRRRARRSKRSTTVIARAAAKRTARRSRPSDASRDRAPFTRGADAIRRYRSSPPVERTFCGTCGSNLTFGFEPLPDAIWVAIGTLDDDPVLRPQGHIFAASIAAWHAITDDLPTFDEYPPQDG